MDDKNNIAAVEATRKLLEARNIELIQEDKRLREPGPIVRTGFTKTPLSLRVARRREKAKSARKERRRNRGKR